MYAVIYNSEDGVKVDFVDKGELKKRLNIEDGTNYYGRTKFVGSVPRDVDIESFDTESLLILKCEIVVPREKVVATELEID